MVAGIVAGTGKKSTGGKFDYLIRGIAPERMQANLDATSRAWPATIAWFRKYLK